ncbi:hypothetical protein I4U23_030802 [Adineta vaga]|nr:hypothetical protein I4U23_030802 [Adineta vaga]
MSPSSNYPYLSQHCFLLDGKTKFPIDSYLSPLDFDKQSCQNQSRSDSFDENFQTINNNKDCQIDENESCSLSFESMRKRFKNKQCSNQLSSRKIAITKRNQWKYQQINHKDTSSTHLITRVMSSLNNTIPIHKSFVDSSLSSRKSTHRLLTFKDIYLQRKSLLENVSFNIRQSRTLFDIYCDRKKKKIHLS